jgi:phenylpropionate dioxygenase-like ring-hydroxylating dioxygenase large terminal subunit
MTMAGGGLPWGWHGPKAPPLVLAVLREFEVPAVHQACGRRGALPARWVRYYNGKVNCETRNVPCLHCLTAGPWLVDMEAAKSYYEKKWGPIGTG